jgi:hypothetical protein
MGTSFSLGNLEEGLYALGLRVEDDSVSGVSRYRDHVGEIGEGDRQPGILEIN